MKIVSFLNVTNLDNLTTDSAYIMYSLLSKCFVANNHKFTFVSPAPLNNKLVEHIPFDFGNNKYAVRTDFDWNKIKNIIIYEKPDIILVNQIELLANYKILMQTIDINIPIIGYAHYIPYSIQRGNICQDISLNKGNINKLIQFSFASGLEAADVVLTHSETSLSYLKSLVLSFNQKWNRKKFKILPPPYDNYLSSVKASPTSNNIIYNHRLYEQYGTSFLVKLAQNLAAEENGYKFEIFDILNNRSAERKILDESVDLYRNKLSKIPNIEMRNDGYNRSIYREALSKAFCCLAPYRRDCPWAMACIDAMCMGLPCVAPNISWFSEFMPKDLLFSDVKSAKKIIKKLRDDTYFWKEKSLEAIEKTKKISPDNQANKLLKIFAHEIEKKK